MFKFICHLYIILIICNNFFSINTPPIGGFLPGNPFIRIPLFLGKKIELGLLYIYINNNNDSISCQ